MPARTVNILVFLFWVVVSANLWGQDIHFSQFNQTPANISPALTGLFDGYYRFTGNYRSQWQSVPVPYRTFSAAFDSKIQHKLLCKQAYLGYGFVFNNDVAGDAGLSLSELGINLAYVRQVGESIYLSAGMQAMLGNKSASAGKILWEEQYNGDQFDPTLPSGEVFQRSSGSLASISAGLNLHFQPRDSRTKVDAGFGLFHLNEPTFSFFDQPDVSLPKKGNGYLLASIQTTEKTDVKFNALFGRQAKYQELVFGAALRYYLGLQKNKVIAIEGGLGIRLGDAFIPSIAVQVGNFEAGLSYDINYSNFKTASLKRGGPELFVRYIIWKVLPPPEFKSCPVF
jgi:type IX secretion system PorP/SprF family membrane protein